LRLRARIGGDAEGEFLTRFDIAEVAPRFPDFATAIIVAENLAIPAARSAALQAFVAEASEGARRLYAGTELSAIPGIAAWRSAYRAFGIKKTSYRSSVERLMKNAIAGTALPEINPFVDAYNAISLRHVLPSGADDLDRVSGDLVFRYARAGDDFRDMGALDESGAPRADPPKDGEVVYADATKILCRRWNWRQDARSVIRRETRRAVVTLQANGFGDPSAAAEELVALLSAECGGRYAVALLDAANPGALLPAP
jgi:DNA/RNA-binding domain of Phe-tRNA-synthetase-like protein